MHNCLSVRRKIDDYRFVDMRGMKLRRISKSEDGC